MPRSPATSTASPTTSACPSRSGSSSPSVRSASGRRKAPARKTSTSSRSSRRERRAAQVAEVTTPFLERLRRFDEEAAASTSSPLVWATVPAGLVRELARDERVDTIYGDLERGGPETNLSREVVGANLAPANTLDGSGVQVGIVESGGVADTTNPFMTIERNDPGPSCGRTTAHATGVAGIIGARPGVFRIGPFSRSRTRSRASRRRRACRSGAGAAQVTTGPASTRRPTGAHASSPTPTGPTRPAR